MLDSAQGCGSGGDKTSQQLQLTPQENPDPQPSGVPPNLCRPLNFSAGHDPLYYMWRQSEENHTWLEGAGTLITGLLLPDSCAALSLGAQYPGSGPTDF